MMRRSLSKVASNLLRPRVACVAVRSARQSRAFSIATSPGAGVVDRGAFPAYVPVLGMPLPNAGPATLTVDQAIAITETVNSVLEYGVFVDQRFKDIAKLESNPAVKFQLLMETLVEIQLYAALQYGFESSPKGFQDFTMALGQMSQQLTDPTSDDAVELQSGFEETWEIAVRKVFGVSAKPRLTLEQVQAIAAKLSAEMQDAEFLAQIEANVANLPAEQKQLAIEEISYDVFVPIMEKYGFEGDGGFAQLKVELTQKMGDPQVQMNLFALQRAVGSKAGLM